MLAQWPEYHESQDYKLRARGRVRGEAREPGRTPEPTGGPEKFPQLECLLKIRFRFTKSNLLIVLNK